MGDEQKTPPQKNNTLTIVLIVVGALIVLGVGSCVVAGFVAKKAAQGLISGATGGAVKVDDNGGAIKLSDGDTAITAGDSAKWPADMPTDVPQPTFGKVKMSSKITSDNAWNVVLENVTADQFKTYITLLASKGWASESETTFMVSIAQFKKGNWDLTVTHDPSSNGLSINLLPQTK